MGCSKVHRLGYLMNFNMNIILEVISGSRLYGTNIPSSDYDYRGVCTIPIRDMVNPYQGFEQFEDPDGDRVIYHLRKFFDLAAACNPNIIEILFAPRSKIISINDQGKLLLKNKHLFVSQKAVKTFSGYAIQQLKRMTLHKGWMDRGEIKKPLRSDFKLPSEPLFGYEKLEAIMHSPEEAILNDYRDYVSRELKYRSAKKDFDNYRKWMETRNPNRHNLESKFGFDSKFAMHLFRLFLEGKELLETGNITLPSPYAGFLLDIRNGIYEYDELMAMIDSFGRLDDLDFGVPEKPNYNKLKELYYSILGI